MKEIVFDAFAPRGLVEAINAATSRSFDWTSILTVNGHIFSLACRKPDCVERYTICIRACRGQEEDIEQFCYDGWGPSGLLTTIIEAEKSVSTATLMTHSLTHGITHPGDDGRYEISIAEYVEKKEN